MYQGGQQTSQDPRGGQQTTQDHKIPEAANKNPKIPEAANKNPKIPEAAIFLHEDRGGQQKSQDPRGPKRSEAVPGVSTTTHIHRTKCCHSSLPVSQHRSCNGHPSMGWAAKRHFIILFCLRWPSCARMRIIVEFILVVFAGNLC
jgi:hypothetical protein